MERREIEFINDIINQAIQYGQNKGRNTSESISDTLGLSVAVRIWLNGKGLLDRYDVEIGENGKVNIQPYKGEQNVLQLSCKG